MLKTAIACTIFVLYVVVIYTVYSLNTVFSDKKPKWFFKKPFSYICNSSLLSTHHGYLWALVFGIWIQLLFYLI